MLTRDDKRSLYRSGVYEFNLPPVQHANWTEDDWIDYIDAHGKWFDSARHHNEIETEDGVYYKCKLLSIDAWRSPDGGWDWNNMHTLEEGIMIRQDSQVLSSPRSALAYMRGAGWLNEYSKGRVRVDMGEDLVDGVCLVVEARSTGEPLFALTSIHG